MMQRFPYLVCWMIFMVACGSPENVTIDQSWNDPLIAFNDFPDSLYLGIYFDQPVDAACQNLEQNNYELIDSSGAWYYWSELDSTQLILPATRELGELKIILKSIRIKNESNRMKTLFRSTASSHQMADRFSIFNFERARAKFKLTLFEQDEFIRLNFEKKKSR